jgi:hypothetical protein
MATDIPFVEGQTAYIERRLEIEKVTVTKVTKTIIRVSNPHYTFRPDGRMRGEFGSGFDRPTLGHPSPRVERLHLCQKARRSAYKIKNEVDSDAAKGFSDELLMEIVALAKKIPVK